MMPLSLLLLPLLLLESTVSRGDTLVINNASGLVKFSNDVNQGTNFKGTTILLSADIEFDEGLSGQFMPIGSVSDGLFDAFDGQGHKISNLAINSSATNYAGLFGSAECKDIKNLVLDSTCSVSSSSSVSSSFSVVAYAGGIIGLCIAGNETCRLENVVNMARVSITERLPRPSEKSVHIGGISGALLHNEDENTDAAIVNCVNYGSVAYYYNYNNSDGGTKPHTYIGGIAGYDKKATVQNSANYGALISSGPALNTLYVGGLIGYANEVIIANTLSVGPISSGTNTSAANVISGAVSGFAERGCVLDHCLWTKDVGVEEAYGGNTSAVAVLNSTTAEFDVSTMLDLNDYAGDRGLSKWVMLHLNGGRLSGLAEEDTLIVTQRNFPVPEKEDFVFSFWCTDERCTGVYDPATTSLADIDDLYAAWTVRNFSLTFDYDNGTALEVWFMYGETIKYPPEPTRPGYTFSEWCTEDRKVCSPVYMPNKNIILHPQWTPVPLSSSSSSSSSLVSASNESSASTSSTTSVSSSNSSSSSSSGSGGGGKDRKMKKTLGTIVIASIVVSVIVIIMIAVAVVVIIVKKKRSNAKKVDVSKPLIRVW